jgi:ferredoxin
MIDPIVILFGAFGMSGTAGYIFLGILAVVIIASFILPGIWCRRICPLGGMQELLATPAIGIRRRTKEEAPNKKESAMARRSFLSLAAGIAGGFAIRWIISPVRRRLRPPGAVPGNRFKTLCVRCGNCVRVCPSRIIAQDSNSPDTIGILAPKVSFDSDYCRQDCNLCGQGCPSGAIKPLPLIEKNKRKIGLARIDEPSCRLAWDAKCDLCMYVCPCEAIEEVFNRDKYLYTISINPEKCNGCGHCKIICPEHAISMKPA